MFKTMILNSGQLAIDGLESIKNVFYGDNWCTIAQHLLGGRQRDIIRNFILDLAWGILGTFSSFLHLSFFG